MKLHENIYVLCTSFFVRLVCLKVWWFGLYFLEKEAQRMDIASYDLCQYYFHVCLLHSLPIFCCLQYSI